MMPRFHYARSATIGLVAAFLLGGCELALHEVQQGATGGCDPWQAGCPGLVEDADRGPVHPPRVGLARLEIVSAAVDAPYRPCNGVGLVCQGRIIGDVLWDEYVMVLSGEVGYRLDRGQRTAGGPCCRFQGQAAHGRGDAAGGGPHHPHPRRTRRRSRHGRAGPLNVTRQPHPFLPFPCCLLGPGAHGAGRLPSAASP